MTKVKGDGRVQKLSYMKWISKYQTPQVVKARFTGCLLGGAVGDALGAPVEFMKRAEILHRFGSDGITKYELAYGRLGAITDDTQMTLFTAEGLIRAWVRGRFRGITTYSGVTRSAYLRWLKTQDERYDDIESNNGWLFKQRELHNRRAPGNTCISALRVLRESGENMAQNDSKGCGGVMRVAPVGLFAWHFRRENPQQTFELGIELAALTHGHPTGMLTAGVFAVLILALADGLTLLDALKIAKDCLLTKPDNEETLLAIQMAESLAVQGMPHDEAIVKLGQGWVAEEALAISIYCALVARNFKHGVLLAVNHDGDSDSTGSITGNLLGTIHGVNAIPTEWLTSLELRDVITELAEDLYRFIDWKIGAYFDSPENEQILDKYPGD